MTLTDERRTREQQPGKLQGPTRLGVLDTARARKQIANAADAVKCGVGQIQDRLAKVWTNLLPVKREDMANDKLWADLLAIKNRMVFYNPAGLRPNKMKASLSLMCDDYASALKEMICRLDSDVRAAA